MAREEAGGGIDLEACTRHRAQKSLWKEAISVFHQRHSVVHEAASVTGEEAEHAVQVAAYIMESLIPKLLGELGLVLDEKYTVREKSEHESQKAAR